MAGQPPKKNAMRRIVSHPERKLKIFVSAINDFLAGAIASTGENADSGTARNRILRQPKGYFWFNPLGGWVAPLTSRARVRN
ncbi:MAG: hypothetical protein CM15mP125_0500 [Gammaproteobacteria bacterium]|nr:MAG: hypothetical protein CM15mP125_0500 [Gammaproteobacteria bacterium]